MWPMDHCTVLVLVYLGVGILLGLRLRDDAVSESRQEYHNQCKALLLVPGSLTR